MSPTLSYPLAQAGTSADSHRFGKRVRDATASGRRRPYRCFAIACQSVCPFIRTCKFHVSLCVATPWEPFGNPGTRTDSARRFFGKMSIDASHTLRQAGYEPTLSRGELVELLRDITARLGAEHYVVVQCLSGRANEDSRILACNWVFDALQAIGQEHLARIVRSHLATPLGSRARPFTLECLAGLLPPTEVEELKRNGHRAFACQQLLIGQARFGILFSAPDCEGLDEEAIAHAHMISSLRPVADHAGADRRAGRPAVGARARMPALGVRGQDDGRGGADPRRLVEHGEQLRHARDSKTVGEQSRHGHGHGHQEQTDLRGDCRWHGWGHSRRIWGKTKERRISSP